MRKHRGFILLTLALIAVTAFCITGTVKSQSSENVQIDKKYYEQLEKEYVREIRTYLTEEGYENSGVMLTYISTGGNGRKYTVTIHNEKINGLSQGEKTELKNKILGMAFEIPGCTFFQEFLSI